MNYADSLGSFASSAPQSSPLALNLLGAPRVLHCGQPLRLTRSQTRAVLFRLGVRLEPVSRDELAALFWPEIANSEARQNLRRLLSFVRSDLPEPDAIVATSDSVGLHPELVWSDASSLCDAARNNTLAGWRAVADLYTGAFLSGFSLRNSGDFEQWQAVMEERFRATSLAALAKLIQYSAGTGDQALAVQYARRYLEIDNVAESVHRELIVLYTQLGERELALRQYEECVRVLEKELGVDPLPETRAAYALALQNDHTAAPISHVPLHVPRVVPSIDLPLIGRERAQQELEAAYKHLRHGGFIFITGELGIGKSRLLHTFAAQRDAVAIVGHCHAGIRLLPYHPIIEALRHALLTAELGESVDSGSLAEIAQLVPEVRIVRPGLPATAQVDAKERRSRQFEAVARALVGMAAHRQVVLCLEDLEWADEETLAWLHFAARRLRNTRVCVVASCTRIHSKPLAELMSFLEGQKLLAEVRLQGLDTDAAAEIVRAVDPALVPDEEVVRKLIDATGGNTLFLLEYVRELTHGAGAEGTANLLTTPESVGKIVALRIGRLSALGKQILETAAVLNPHLDRELILATAARSPMEVGEGIEELVRHQLLAKRGQELQFLHSVVQQGVYDGLPLWRRSQLHRRAAAALTRLNVEGDGYTRAEIALHLDAAMKDHDARPQILSAPNAANPFARQGAEPRVTAAGSPSLLPTSAVQFIRTNGETPGHHVSDQDMEYEARGVPSTALFLGSRDSLLQLALLCNLAGVLVLSAQCSDASALLATVMEQIRLLL